MVSFFKLIRLQNLVIIGITFYAIRYFVVLPFLQSMESSLYLNHTDFFLLCISTMLVAAGGYAINDYFDVKIDKINKPQKMVIDKNLGRRIGIFAHIILSTLAILTAVFLALKLKIYSLVILHFLTITLLVIYSLKFKKEFFTGNFLIALLSGLIPFLACYYDVSSLLIIKNFTANIYLQYILMYVLFAFLISLCREIVKDMEDLKGDQANDCKTLPILWGIKKAKHLVMIIIVLTLLLLLITQYLVLNFGNKFLAIYILLTIELPLIYLFLKLKKAQNTDQFNLVSTYFKLIMLSGIGTTWIHYITSV